MLQKFENNPFVIKQLLKICWYLDFSDEAGRKVLYKLLIQRLPMSTECEFALTLDILLKMENQRDVYILLSICLYLSIYLTFVVCPNRP